MNNSNNKKSKHLLTAMLASLIAISALTASVMSGCGEGSSETTETVAVTGTSIVTSVIEETYYTDENGNVVSESDESGDSENSENQSSKNSNSGSESSSGNSSSGNSGSSDNSNSSSSSSGKNSSSSSSSNKNSNNSSSKSNNNSSNSSNSSSSNSSNNSSSKTLSIGGKKYSVGDTVTCTYQLTSPENIENFQGVIKYDSKYLKVKKAVTCGPAKSGSLINYNLDNQIKFNGINISNGYNYKKAKDFITVTYEVVSTGSTNPTLTWDVVTGVSQKSYVKDGKAANGLELTASYS